MIELAILKELYNKGKIEEVLLNVKNIEQNENLYMEETLKTQIFKDWLYIWLDHLESALKITEKLYKEKILYPQ